MRSIARLAIARTLAAGSHDSLGDEAGFRDRVAPILRGRCLRCHQGGDAKGDVGLSRASGVFDGLIVVPGKPEEGRLIEVVAGPKPEMPRAGDRLDPGQVETLRAWVAEGAPWPEGLVLKADPLDWWSLRPLARPAGRARRRPGREILGPDAD